MARTAVAGALAVSLALAALAGCGSDATAPRADLSTGATTTSTSTDSLARLVRQLTAARGVTPLGRPPAVRPELVRLGRMLAFDKILSGNRDISCMTCHLPQLGLGDDRSLSIGAGGVGLGKDRIPPGGKFIPRNAPAVYNMFAIQPLFWDGRVFRDEQGSYHTPAGADLTPAMTAVFDFGTLSAQPMFPVLSRAEMRGDAGNELAAIPDANVQAIWQGLMARLGRIGEYRRMFEAAYPGQRYENMSFAYASNAIAGFLTAGMAFNNSPWDRFLAGDDGALTPVQLAGAKDFMSAKCSICHNGPAFTDDKFHNVAVAQLGPGEGDGAGGRDDFGHMRVTGSAADKYAFRTPPLRNVELTAPYGHDGAIVDLRAFVAHYSESDVKLRAYDASQLEPALQGTVLQNVEDILAARDTLLQGVVFTDQTIDEVTEFMKALTDPAARQLGRITPARVPSGLPVD